MTAGSFEAVLEEYLQRMRAREPFVMYRIGDGELMLVDGVAVGPDTQASRVDCWQAPNYLTVLGRDLRTVLATQESWAHFGIPCPCCNMSGFQRLHREISHAPVFPANLFINANYPRFRQFLQELTGPVALVLNERASTGRMPFQVLRAMRVPDNCVAHYEMDRLEILAQARDFCRDLNRCLVLVSAGPLSEALIFVMWNENPNNTYVDVGSALDELSYGQKTRSYMWEGNEYATRHCPLPSSAANDVADAMAFTDNAWGYGGWALSKDALSQLCQYIPTEVPTRILELGGGQSTLFWNALSASRRLDVTTIEHDEAWAHQIRARLEGSDSVRVIHSGLKQLTDEEFEAVFTTSAAAHWNSYGRALSPEHNNAYTIHNAFYANILDLLDESIDVLVVDGPHGNGRSLAYPLFQRALKPGAIILIDDFDHYPFLSDLARVMPYEELARGIGDKHWVLARRLT